MTCIVGLVEGETVWVGGDSLSCDDHVGSIRATRKVFRVGEMLVGVCGDTRTSQVIQYAFDPPDPMEDEDLVRYLAARFVPALHQALQTPGVHLPEGAEKTRWSVLLGLRGRLFAIYDDFQVEETADGFNAVGCGYRTALGSLHTTAGITGLPANNRVFRALDSTAFVDIHVAPPFVIESVG